MAILLIGLVVLVQLPGIQTYLADKFIEKIEYGLGGKFTLESIRIRPFNRVVINNLTLVDDAPFDGGDFAPQDTVANIKTLVAYCSLGSLLNPEKLSFRRVRADGLYFCLVVEALPSMSNIKRIVNAEEPEQRENGSNIITIKKFEADNARYRMLSIKEIPTRQGAINWSDLDATAEIRARDIQICGLDVDAVVDRITVREKSGYSAEKICGKAHVTPQIARIEDIKIVDPWSNLNVPLYAMHYNTGKSFIDYCNNVVMEGIVGPSHFDFHSLTYFAWSITNTDISVDIEKASAYGPVNDLSVSSFIFNSLSGIDKSTSDISGRLSVGIKDTEHAEKISLKANIDNISYPFKGHVLSVSGTAKGPLNNLDIAFSSTSDIGSAQVNGSIGNLNNSGISPVTITGQLSTDNLVLGTFIGKDFVRECTASTSIRASLQKGNTSVTVDSLKVGRINILDYDYTGINAAGKFSDNSFDGRIICTDPNLNFIFQGLFNLSLNKKNALYKFYFNLGYADLNAVNLDRRGISKASFYLDADYMRINQTDLIGNIDINSIVLENAAGKHNLGNISIGSHSNDNVFRYNFNSDFADLSYVGSKSISQLPNVIKEVTIQKELPALFGESPDKWNNDNCDLRVNFHDSRDVLSFLVPGLYIADSTSVQLGIGSSGALHGKLSSSRIAYKKKYLKGMTLELDNADGSLNGKLKGGEAMISDISLKDNSLILFADDNHIGVGFEFDNSTDTRTKGELLVTGEFEKEESGKLILTAENLASNLYYEDVAWRIDPSRFIWSKGESLQVDSLRIWSDDQELFMNGRTSLADADTLTATISRFDIGNLGHIIAPEIGMAGKANGKALLLSGGDHSHNFLINFTSDSTYFAGRPAGQVRIGGNWSSGSDMINFALSNLLDSAKSIHITGNYSPKSRFIYASSSFSNFNLGYAEPLTKGILNRLDGKLSGNINISGKTDSLNVNSKNLYLDDTRVGVLFTNVPYTLSGPLNIDNSGIHFDNLSLHDDYVGTGALNGILSFNDFKTPKIDVGIEARMLKVLNTTEKDNSSFYGDLTANGKVSISGPLDAIMLDIDVTTANKGQFYIPLSGSVSPTSSSKILTFKEAEKYVWIDPYEQMIETLEIGQKKDYDLGVKLNVNVTNDVEAVLEIDKDTGNILNGRGSGNIKLDVRPIKNIFNINGDYNLRSGNAHLNAMNITEKDFSIQDGSSIKFNGDIMESDLDITALYSIKTSLGNLIADSTSVSMRRSVDCGIKVYDKLKDPQFKFSIDIPDLEPSIKSRVETALNTDDKIQKQFIALLVTNNFLPDEQSGIFNNSSSIIFSNVANIMANQLNNVLERLEIPVDLGLSYQNLDGGTNIFDVAISTQLFNNRVIVNGAIGNRSYKNRASSNVVGDLDIEVKLDRAGAVRMSLFSHSADEYTNYLDNSQRNGIGVAYQKEFNNFKEFWKRLLKKNKEDYVVKDIEKKEIVIE